MKLTEGEQVVRQLEKRKGGYFYLTISAETVNQFPSQRHTRLLCTLDNTLTFPCGLNHLGDGNFFVILGSKNLKAVQKKLGESLLFSLSEDPNPLGVSMPEVLEVLFEQDETLKSTFNALSPGKKRSVIHAISRIRDIDKQVANALKLINQRGVVRR